MRGPRLVAVQRGTCPECGKNVALTSQGYLYRHSPQGSKSFPPVDCAGWGKLPKTEGE